MQSGRNLPIPPALKVVELYGLRFMLSMHNYQEITSE